MQDPLRVFAENHPLYRYYPDVRQQVDAFLATADAPVTMRDAVRVLEDFAHLFQDEHTTVDYDYADLRILKTAVDRIASVTYADGITVPESEARIDEVCLISPIKYFTLTDGTEVKAEYTLPPPAMTQRLHRSRASEFTFHTTDDFNYVRIARFTSEYQKLVDILTNLPPRPRLIISLVDSPGGSSLTELALETVLFGSFDMKVASLCDSTCAVMET